MAVPQQASPGQHAPSGQQDAFAVGWAAAEQHTPFGQQSPSGQQDAFAIALVLARLTVPQQSPSGQQAPSGQQESFFTGDLAPMQQAPSGQQAPPGQQEALALASVALAWAGVLDRVRTRAVPTTSSPTTRAAQTKSLLRMDFLQVLAVRNGWLIQHMTSRREARLTESCSTQPDALEDVELVCGRVNDRDGLSENADGAGNRDRERVDGDQAGARVRVLDRRQGR
jgi:hypothetical protein